MTKEFNQNIAHGFFWSILERFSSKIVLFILQLVLARLLIPEDYGLCALMLIFINLGGILITSGFPSALIQKKNVSKLDYSSIFYLCLTTSIVFYLILWFSAPVIAEFFEDSRMVLMIRILALSLPIGAYNSLQITILKRNISFKPIFISNAIAAVASAIVSIVLAIKGYGAWSIIFQYIVNVGFTTIILFFYTKWIPSVEFSMSNVKSLFSFGWKYMATSLTSSIAQDIYTAAIGKTYNKSQLGIYDTGIKISQNITDTVTNGMSSVLFPVFAKLQDSPPDVKLYLKSINQLACFLIFPLMIGLIPLSKPLILLILTEKWIESVPFMQISCLMFALYPLHYSNMQAISGRGFAGKSLKIEIYKKISQLTILAVTLPFSLILVAFGRIISSFVELYIIMIPNKQLIDYSPIQQIKDVFPSLINALLSMFCMFAIHLMLDSATPIIDILLQIIVCVMVYYLLSYINNRTILRKFFSIIKVQ